MIWWYNRLQSHRAVSSFCKTFAWVWWWEKLYMAPWWKREREGGRARSVKVGGKVEWAREEGRQCRRGEEHREGGVLGPRLPTCCLGVALRLREENLTEDLLPGPSALWNFPSGIQFSGIFNQKPRTCWSASCCRGDFQEWYEKIIQCCVLCIAVACLCSDVLMKSSPVLKCYLQSSQLVLKLLSECFTVITWCCMAGCRRLDIV